MWTRTKVYLVTVTITALLGCGAGSDRGDAGADGNAPTSDGGNSVRALHDCTMDQFVDETADSAERIVHFHSPRYSPRCMTIRAGQSVTFMGNMTVYPLSPGVAPSRQGDPPGTEPNPIPAQTMGEVVTVQFPNPGLYPYYCPTQEATNRMYGVIQVR